MSTASACNQNISKYRLIIDMIENRCQLDRGVLPGDDHFRGKVSIYFKSVQESLDTSTPGGKLIFHVFGALAEFERDIIRERTLAGLAAARARGRVGGRPRKLSKEQVEMAKKLIGDPTIPIADICKTLDVSKATLYRHVKEGV